MAFQVDEATFKEHTVKRRKRNQSKRRGNKPKGSMLSLESYTYLDMAQG